MKPAFRVKFYDAKSGVSCKGAITHAYDSKAALMQVIHRELKKRNPHYVKNNGGLIIWRVLNKKDNSTFSITPVYYDQYKKEYVSESFRKFFDEMT